MKRLAPKSLFLPNRVGPNARTKQTSRCRVIWTRCDEDEPLSQTTTEMSINVFLLQSTLSLVGLFVLAKLESDVGAFLDR